MWVTETEPESSARTSVLSHLIGSFKKKVRASKIAQ